MKSFSYKGYHSDGTSCRGLIEADSPKAAREQLAMKKILVDRLDHADSTRGPMPSTARGIIYRELASLLKSGMPMVNALGALLKTPDLDMHANVLAGIRDHVRGGSSLAAALKLAIADISAFETATIDVAERTASLEMVLHQLAVFIETQDLLRQRIQRALIYPALVLALGIMVGVVMLGVLLPRTQQMIGGVTALPALTKAMLWCADMFFPWGMLAIAIMVLLVLVGLKQIKQDEELRVRYNRFYYATPLLGKAYRELVSSRFARTLSILLRSGVSPVEGVPLAARATGSTWCERLAVGASAKIRDGYTLESAIRELPPLTDALTGWIGVGETSGDLPALLDHAADRCDRRFEHFLAKMLALMEPVLLLVIGLFVLLITLAVLLPVFSLTDAVLG